MWSSAGAGEIATPMTGAHDEDRSDEERLALPAERPGNAHEIADAIAFLARPDARSSLPRNCCIRSSWRKMSRASLAIGLSPVAVARESITV